MKLLLDENLPKRIKALLSPHEAFTVRDMGWNGRGNGELLRSMKEHGFDVLLTFDKNLRYQQNFKRYDLPVLVLDAEDNTYLSLAPIMSNVLAALERGVQAGPTIIR
ncbi:MAG: DUF5615 family PIN-like protein [Flavobacteriales bacterium]|nr:DUF5615 family PIN-like protein [Flavobacteriales bacterium]